MSTWHQDRRPSLPPADSWTIVSDPPNDMLSFTTFPTEAAARTRLELLQVTGRGAHCYLQPPRGRP